MPIITPIYPHKNAAYTVRTSTRNIIVRELQRGKLSASLLAKYYLVDFAGLYI